MDKGFRLITAARLATAMAVILSAPALAQTASDPPHGAVNGGKDAGSGGLMQDIVVTATRREETTSKVPQSIVAYSQRTLDAQGIRSFEDLTSITPGVDLSRSAEGNGTLTSVTIRGIVSNSEVPTTGVYIDDTPTQVRFNGLSLFGTAVPALFDLDRVEVLRGPQGTLFGAGSEGGAIRFILAQPSLDKYSGYARAEVSDTQSGAASYNGGAAIGGPIVADKIGFRLSVYGQRDGGYVDRVDPTTGAVRQKNANGGNTESARLAITMAPTDWLKITPSVIYNRQRIDDTDFYWEMYSNPSKQQFGNGKNVKEPSTDKVWLPALRAEADLGFASLISATSYMHRNSNTIVDETNLIGTYWLGDPFIGSTAQAPEFATARFRQFSQEVRLQSTPGSRFQWLLGGFYLQLKDREHQATDGRFAQAAIESGGTPLYNGIYAWDVTEQSTDRQYAGFGEASYQLTDTLKATAGVRVARFKTHYTRVADGPLYGGHLTYDLHAANTAVTPKFNLTWQANQDFMLYGTVSKGVRQGGVNRAAFPLAACLAVVSELGLTQFPTDYQPDQLWNYEVGSKGKLLDGKLRYEASLFFDKWNKIQRRVAPPECGGSSFTGNLGSATSKGFDLSLLAQVTPALSLNLQVAYTDAKYDDTLDAGSTFYVVDGDTLGVTPWQITGTARYEAPVSSTTRAYLQGQVQYHSRDPGPTETQDPLTASYDPDIPTVAGYTLVNLRAGATFKGFDASVYVNNLLNSHPLLSRFHALVGDPLYIDRTMRPRTAGLTVTYHY